MKKQILYSDINSAIKTNRQIVVAEYTIQPGSKDEAKTRGIVHQVKPKKKVTVIHGDVSADYFYSFDNAREAQEFINESEKGSTTN